MEFLALFSVLLVLYRIFSINNLLDSQSMVRCIIVQILETVFGFTVDKKPGMHKRGSGLCHANGGNIWETG